MEQNSFLKTVAKNLHCSRRKKKEICKDIQSDIEVALQNGESWADIETRMGTPREIAKEFNENMPPKELQNTRKRRIAFIIIIAVFLLAAVAIKISVDQFNEPKIEEFGSSGLFQEDAVDQKVEEIVILVGADRLEELLNDYSTADLSGGITADALRELKKLLNPPWGNYQKITSSYYFEVISPGKIWTIADVVALYDNCTISYRLTFTPEMKLDGIYMK